MPHAFTGRGGGVSAGDFQSLNLSYSAGDDESAVSANRSRLLAAFDESPEKLAEKQQPKKLVTLTQVHGNRVILVDIQTPSETRADGMLTRDPAALLTILVADCLPVLMATKDGKRVAAVHAGWRGTESQILKTALSLFKEAGHPPQDLLVALGPGIGPCCFEIGPEVKEALLKVFPDEKDAFRSRPGGKYDADIWRLNTALLEEEGVPLEQIEVIKRCTYCDSDFYSHRRDQGHTGRQAGIIAPIS